MQILLEVADCDLFDFLDKPDEEEQGENDDDDEKENYVPRSLFDRIGWVMFSFLGGKQSAKHKLDLERPTICNTGNLEP